MALVLADRVQEVTTSTGTGAITLSGAVLGYQTFAVIGNGNKCYYTIADQGGANWEVGIGTYTASGTTLSRDTVLASSNGGALVPFTSGTKTAFVTYPSEKSINYDLNGVATIGETLGYSDTGVVGSFASSVAGYNQVIIQNKTADADASSNLNVSNDAATDTTGFAELGINSSIFSNGPGCFNIPGASYLASASTDLSIGTYGAYDIHFATNSSTTDSMTIYDNGGISLGAYGNPGIGNIALNKVVSGYNAITSAGGTTVLVAESEYYQRVTGSAAQTVQLPDATTLLEGTTFIIDNDSTQEVTITNGATTSLDTVASGSLTYTYLISNATVAGTWARYHFLPNSYDFGTTTANFGSATLVNGTWHGNTVDTPYGGTGLTDFTSGGAMYATSTSALTTGTLPVPSGGTGQTSFASGYIPYGNTSAALQSSNKLQFNGDYLVVGGTDPLGGTTNPIAAFTGSTDGYIQTYVYNAEPDAISASSDFVAYTDNSTDTHGWADLGFTSSAYDDDVYTITGPNEAYLLGSAPDASGATGNLVYATDDTGTANAHQWYVGGFTQAKSAYKMELNSNYLELKTPVYVTGSTGTSGQVLTSAGSGSAPTWTTPVTGGGTVTTTDFTATAGQTVFTVTYTVGATEVYQNGAKLGIADYTATNGTSITLATGATAGDLIEVVTFSNLNLYSTITYEDFNGTGSQTVFTMSAVPANSASLLVAISGVVQDPGTYTVSSTTLTFLTAPPAGTGNVSVRYLGIASVGTVGSFSGGTTGLTPASATTGAVVLGGTLATTNGGTGLTTVGTNGQVLTSNGTSLSWTTINSGASISNDTSTASFEYPLFANATTGTPTTLYTSNTKYTYKPSTGDLQASQVIAGNGLVLNSSTISTSYTVASGQNALSVGPITIASGVTVTVPSGQRWVIL